MFNPIYREHNFDEFLKVLRRTGRPSHLPFYEHYVSTQFFARSMNIPDASATPENPDYWRLYVKFWLGLGFDCVPMEIPLDCPIERHDKVTVSQGSESGVMIRTMEDFEKYPWPAADKPIDFSHFEKAAKYLPEGVKIVGGVGAGPFEWTTQLMGVQGLSLAIYTNPELVEAVIDKMMAMYQYADHQLAAMDFIGALRQGDDLGFKTSTFLSPEHLRQYIFPIYKRMAAEAHAAGKPFILHSCGNLKEIYEDLIEDCNIDAKHSFEDVIWPVNEYKKEYGQRMTPLGGLDVDMICRLPKEEIRAYTRRMIETCWTDGWWALGTGNSLTNYMPVENYLTMLDEGIRVAG